jgi:hypothetical protein
MMSCARCRSPFVPVYETNTSRASFHTDNLQCSGLSCVHKRRQDRLAAEIRNNGMAIRSGSSRVRQFILSLVALVAIGHANLTTDLTGRKPNGSGITQLGRDIVRKSLVEVADHRMLTKRSRNTIDD